MLNSFYRKYKVKIEKFLKDLLDEGEEFVVCHQSHVNDEQVILHLYTEYPQNIEKQISIICLFEVNSPVCSVNCKIR